MPEKSSSMEVVTKTTDRSVQETVARLIEIISTKSLRLFAVIDQREEALAIGLSLRDTVLVLFGDPRAGTPVMTAAPLSALDLPLKILVWSDNGRTTVSYESPQSLASRHNLKAELATAFDGITALTDALVASL